MRGLGTFRNVAKGDLGRFSLAGLAPKGGIFSEGAESLLSSFS